VSFALEADLCNVLSSRLLATLRLGEHAELLGSLQVGSVIPDLVVVRRELSVHRRLAPVSGLESWIVAEVRRNPGATLAVLADRLFTRVERAERAAVHLERAEVLRRRSDGGYVVRRGLFPAAAQVIAVEAKLHRWHDAIDQATSYRRFANRSFVALPRTTIERTPRISEACFARGLGLIEVWPKGMRVLRPANYHRPASAEWFWVVGQASDQRLATPQRPLRAPAATRAGGQASSGH
jgi:hypothetical protein